MKKLSFILPVYNVEKYVTDCLNSVYAQGLEEDEFEVICVDDGSKDNSGQIIEAYKEKSQLNNLFIKHVANGGLSSARNIGISMANGEYLFFVDSDDYIADRTIGYILNKAIKNDVDMMYFDIHTTSDTNLHTAQYIDEIDFPIVDGKKYFAEHYPNNSACVFLIKRKHIMENHLSFEEGHCCEDGMFSVLSTNCAKRVSYCHVDVYRYVKRVSGTIISNKDKSHLQKMIDDFIYAIKYINEIILKEKELCKATNDYSTEEYIQSLIKRRDSYTFFLQVRIMKFGLSGKKINEYLQGLKELECYPNGGLRSSYGRKLCFISKLFQREHLFKLMCKIYQLVFTKK